MTNLVVPIGMPGCGKSYFAKSLLDLKYAIVSTDGIRIEKYGSLVEAHKVRGSNAEVFATAYRRLDDFLAHSVDVYFDATNLRRRSRDDLREIAAKRGARVVAILFDNELQARWNNRQRDPDAVVPEDVMNAMCDQLSVAKLAVAQERFDQFIRIESIQ